MAHDVFISHSAKDKTTADAVCATLESEGIRCWIAPRDVVPGTEWGRSIIEAIERTRIMVLLFTANANASPQIRREVERAANHDVVILPFRVENVIPDKSLEYFVGNVHWQDALTPPLEVHLGKLAKTVRALIAGSGSGYRHKPESVEVGPSEPIALLTPENFSTGGTLGTRDICPKAAAPGTALSFASARRSNLAAYWSLALFAALQLVTWTYRSAMNIVIGRIAEDLHATGSVFIRSDSTPLVCYILASLLAGWLGDRVSRKPLVVAGALLMSLGALATAGIENYASLLACQSAVNVGAAVVGVLALSLLSDFYSERNRTWVFSIFLIMFPVGNAISGIIWGRMAQSTIWRSQFVLLAIPGLLFAALYGALGHEPERGSCDAIQPSHRPAAIAGLLTSPAFLAATLGTGAILCAIATTGNWVFRFLMQIDGMAVADVDREAALAAATASIAGIAVGGWLGHHWLRSNYRALYQVAFWGATLALPFFAMFLFGNSSLAIPLLFASEFFLFLPVAPIFAAAANSISAPVRSRAFGIFLAFDQFCHFFLGLRIIAWVAERNGLRFGLATPLIFLAIAAIILLVGARFAPAWSGTSELKTA
jgi:MFS transporter, Spinster family, sphingosine-1-phosphate transporter